MTYKAQLVVRARSKDGAAIIDKVKEMASDQDKTYSEMAVELLGRGLNADADVDATFETGEVDEEVEEAEPVEEVDDGAGQEPAPQIDEPPPEPPPVGEQEVPEKEPDPRAPLPAEEAGPPVDLDLPPEEIVHHYVQRREERGERAAARILVDFFAQAGPGEGGNLKNKLQDEFTAADYDDLMEPIKRTDEYSEYTRRAISEPSPYSEVK